MFNRLSIRYKLVVLLGASAAIALAISSLLTLYSTFVTQRAESLQTLHQLAELSSENLRAALAFHDEESAQRMLASFRSNPHILVAVVYDDKGREFSGYRAEGFSSAEAEALREEMLAGRETLFRSQAALEKATLDHQYVVRPIVFEGEAIGALAVLSDNQALRDKIVHYVVMQILISFATLLILVGISWRLQRHFTQPIFQLIDTMGEISRTKNYDLSVSLQRNDEFNDLCVSFNTMLAEIHERDVLLNRQATQDALTGLANRRHAMEVFHAMVARALRKQEPLGIVMLDVDYFKRVNDSHGHPAGDAVLREVAALLTHCVREIDLVARFGGEEFLALCDGADMATTGLVAERIRSAVEKRQIDCGDGVSLNVTVSLGYYAAVPESGGVEGMLRIADEALYKAKNLGRNRVEKGEKT